MATIKAWFKGRSRMQGSLLSGKRMINIVIISFKGYIDMEGSFMDNGRPNAKII